MAVYKCSFCERQLGNHGALVLHEKYYCSSNPDKQKRNGANDYTKARNLGLPDPKHLSEEGKLRLAEASRKRGQSERTKKKLSEIAKENNFGGHNSKQKIMYNGVCLHSSYETKLAMDLDANKIAWNRPSPIEWTDDEGKTHRYYADFYLPEYEIYLDPKNDFLIKNVNPAFGITDHDKIKKVMIQNNVKIFILDKDQLSWNSVLALLV